MLIVGCSVTISSRVVFGLRIEAQKISNDVRMAF
jgi:hypothetical protein